MRSKIGTIQSLFAWQFFKIDAELFIRFDSCLSGYDVRDSFSASSIVLNGDAKFI